MAIIDYPGGISRDTHVSAPNVFANVIGRGQGCETVWYDDVASAQRITALWREVIEEPPNGWMAGLCDACRHAHGYHCAAWKDAVARGEIAPPAAS